MSTFQSIYKALFPLLLKQRPEEELHRLASDLAYLKIENISVLGFCKDSISLADLGTCLACEASLAFGPNSRIKAIGIFLCKVD